MSETKPNIQIAVDLTNPGQFFACCGLLELADRLSPGAQGWFDLETFCLCCGEKSLKAIIDPIGKCTVTNTMSLTEIARLKQLSDMDKKQRAEIKGADDEKKALESLNRELPIVLGGRVDIRIDWFTDDYSGGSRFKTWAGQQSVLNICRAMHGALEADSDIWSSHRNIGLPFNFDSDLGGQGSALDIGFSFDPLAGSEATKITGTCKPTLEFLCFVGLQRFRPREIPRQNRFVFTAWNTPLAPCVASAIACDAMTLGDAPRYEFKLLYRTKYLKSFLPAIPFQGDRDE